MFLHGSILVAALLVAGPLSVRAQDEVERAIYDFETAMRNFGMYVDDADKINYVKGYYEKAEGALQKLQTLRPDHANIPVYKKQLSEAKEKLAAGLLAPLRRQFEEQQRSFQYSEENVKTESERENAGRVADAIRKMRETLDGVQKMLAENKESLESKPGWEWADQVRRWADEAKKRIARHDLLCEVMNMIYVQGSGATMSLEQAIRMTARYLDQQDADKAIRSWEEARKGIALLRDKKFAEVPLAKQWLAKYDEVAARVDKELKPIIAKTQTAPLLQNGRDGLKRLRDSMDEEDGQRVKNNYPIVAKIVADLKAEWADVPEVKEFLADAEPMLEQAQKQFGLKPVEAVKVDGDIPSFQIDYTAPAAVQEKLDSLNMSLQYYRDRQAEAQRRIADLSGERGTYGPVCDQVYRDVESCAKTMIGQVRAVEETANELRKLDAKHPAVETMKTAVPRLIKKANDLKRYAIRKCEYAFQVYAIADHYDLAGIPRDKYDGRPEEIVKACAAVLEGLKRCEEHYAAAVAAFPNEHAEADAWAKKVRAWKEEAKKKLVETCLSEVPQIGQKRITPEDAAQEAKYYIDLLKSTLPDAPENGEIGKILGGALAERSAAEEEIRKRRELLLQRAAESTEGLKARYEAYRNGKKPESPDADTVLDNLEAWKGKYIGRTKGEWSISISSGIGIEAYNGKMNDISNRMVKRVLANHGLPAEEFDRFRDEGAVYLGEPEIVCEIVGTVMITPKHYIRDAGGNIIGSIDGTPYPVPAAEVRAILAKRYVMVPGVGNSLEAIKLDGVMP